VVATPPQLDKKFSEDVSPFNIHNKMLPYDELNLFLYHEACILSIMIRLSILTV
jgi:hypothetical protein